MKLSFKIYTATADFASCTGPYPPVKALYIRVGSPNKSDNCPVALRNPVWLEVSHES